MTVPIRLWHGPTPRHVALLLALALLVALAAFPGVAHAQAERTQYPGQIGTIVERSGDRLAPTVRYRGLDRFETARLIATDDQSPSPSFLGADTVLIARGDIFPDALAGHYLAGQVGAPLLLVTTRQIVSDTVEALDDIDPDNLVLLGGLEAISQEVENEFRSEFNVRRIGGVDRYETAALLAAEGAVGELDGKRTAFVANGNTGVDALVAGSISFAEDLPILLTPEDRLDNDTDAALDSLDIEQVIVPGGMVAIEQPVRDAITAKGIDIIPVQGPTRVETALELASFAVDNFGFTFDHVNFARGDVFVDALTVGPHAGRERSVLLLTATPTDVPESVLDFLQQSRTGCAFDLLHLAGGFLAIADAAEQAIRQAATSAGVACNVELTPETATNTVGETHRVTATVTDNVGGPVGSVPVTFRVRPETAAPTATPEPARGDASTGGSGTATFDVNSQTPGMVTITACITDAEGEEVCDTATKTWEPAPPVGPVGEPELDLTPDLATNVVGQPHEITIEASRDVGMPAADAFVNLDAYRLDPAAQAPEGSPPGTQVYTLYQDSETATDEDGRVTLNFPTVPPTDPTVLYLVACAQLAEGEAFGERFEGDCLEQGSAGQLLVVDGVPQNLREDLQIDFGRKEYVAPPGLNLTPDLATNVVGQPHQVTIEASRQAGSPAANAFVNLDAYRLDPAAQAPEGSPPGTQVYTLYEDGDTVTDEDGRVTLTFPTDPPTDPTVLYLVACAQLAEGEALGEPFEGDCLEPGSARQLLVVDGVPQNLREDLQTDYGRKEYVRPPAALLDIEMSGEEVCVNRTTRILCGEGDPQGSAVLDLFLGASEGVICWEISAVTGVALPSTGFHIHEAPAGQNGPVVVVLGTVTASGDSDCLTGLDPALVADIRDNPADYYADLHNNEFPAGAIRGQLSNGDVVD